MSAGSAQIAVLVALSKHGVRLGERRMSALVADVLSGVGVEPYPSRDAIDQSNAFERISESARGRRGRARRESLADLRAQDLYSEYKRGLSMQEVADRHGITASRVSRIFSARGWPVRGRGRPTLGGG